MHVCMYACVYVLSWGAIGYLVSLGGSPVGLVGQLGGLGGSHVGLGGCFGWFSC